jgi:LmbE family N-acetylglucosaminyl deacetylase
MAGRTIMAVGAHPDDIELTCAASLARWAREGDRAVIIVATDGARGGKEIGSDFAAMVRTRREEQDAAAAVLGVDEVVYLGFPDGELEDTPALRGALVRQIRRLRPDVAIAMDPFTVILRNSYVNHRDHRMLGVALIDALYPGASNAGYFPEQIDEGLLPHKVPELLLTATETPNHWVDVTETLDARFDALRQHASQVKLWPENGEAIVRQQRELAAVLGVEHGVGYVEEFRRVVVNPLS